MSQKHVVLLCQTFYPDMQSTSQLYTELFKELARIPRVKITVICGFPAGLVDSATVKRKDKLGDIDIRRCGFRVDIKRNMLSRAISYFSFALHAAWVLFWLRGKDVVVGCTSPPIGAIMLMFTSLIGRFKYLYVIQDVYPEGLFATGLLKRTALSARLWLFLNKLSYRRADRLIVLGRDMTTLLQKDYGISSEKVTYIPHWSIMEPTQPISFKENPLAKELKLLDKFVIQYSGNMGLWHDIEIFLHAAAVLQDEPKIHFLFIGGGRRRCDAEELSKKLALKNLTWMDFVPQERLPESLTCCHVALISLREGLEGIAVPSKLYGILASGRAIIAQTPVTSEITLTINEERCGICVPNGDVDALVVAIRRLFADQSLVSEMSTRAFSAYKNKYTLRHGKAAFSQLCQLEEPAK